MRSLCDGLSRPILLANNVRSLSSASFLENWSNRQRNPNSFDNSDELERRLFDRSGSSSSPFDRTLDRARRARQGLGSMGGNGFDNEYDNIVLSDDEPDGLDENFDTLADGVDGKLKKAARYFEMDDDEVEQEDYTFRADVERKRGDKIDMQDLDLRRPAVRKPFKREKFEVTTEEVLRKADFRNVRFLAQFLSEAGTIVNRHQTKISAKAHRKLAREIKTARALGLMPFTTMGTKAFIFGKSMVDTAEDFEYRNYGGPRASFGADHDFVQQ